MALEDKLYSLLKTYYKFPKIIRSLFGIFYKIIPLSIRYGPVYVKYKKILKKSAYWDEATKNELILSKLKKTFINAYENTTYYKRVFNNIKFNPYKFSNFEEIRTLPFSDKDILRKYKQDIKNKKISESKLLYTTTGGTSGIPVGVYLIKGRERSREYAFMTKQWERVGYKFNDKIARLRGTVIDYKGNNILFKHDPIKNRLLLSTYDLYEENIPLFFKKLYEFQPDYLHAYPSSAVILGKYLIKNSLKLPTLKGVLCGSEQFYAGQRKLIEKAFNTRVYSWYGLTENTTLAGECEVSTNYHLFYEYGYTELIDEKGNIITEPGRQGEIVGTSYEMKAFPIIRYRTGDFAEYVGKKCSCGRNYKLIKNIVGRRQREQIITNKNSLISMTALNMHTNIFDNVRQFQFNQKEEGKVILRIIKNKQYCRKDEMKIRKEFKKKFKELVDMEINYVNKIEFTENGKYKFLIQEIKEL